MKASCRVTAWYNIRRIYLGFEILYYAENVMSRSYKHVLVIRIIIVKWKSVPIDMCVEMIAKNILKKNCTKCGIKVIKRSRIECCFQRRWINVREKVYEMFQSYDIMEGSNCQTMFGEHVNQKEAAIKSVERIDLNQIKEVKKKFFDELPQYYTMFCKRLELLKSIKF